MTLSRLATHLAETIRTSRRVWVPMEDLRRAAVDSDSSLIAAPDQRHRLRDALEELRDAGLAILPSESGRSWERIPHPPLPLRVARPVGPRDPRPALQPPGRGWHHRLSWVPRFLTTLRPPPTGNEMLLLSGVQDMLREEAATHDVPTAERSLHLLGDEKLLDRMLTGRLFTRGGLSTELLRTRQVGRPVTTGTIGPGPVTLIVENVATYDSLSRTLPRDGSGAVGRLVFGQGNDLRSALAALAAEPVPPRDLRYFGDLDPAGVRIPTRSVTVAAGLGLPPLEPAARLYALLLDVGIPQPGRKADVDLSWLPGDLRPRVAALFAAGERLAQEWVGLEELAACDLTDV
ncbi:hypothetical protein GCM10009836_40260 [Pseudonocardia ailaonensis]|uniref:Wadjet protein JetD C-terminal domain-containing protein n=2 Tax=Pseudonocardia ailaonensis TaxID=367279 RepID=A0ABN2N782_9PSEU